MLAGLFFTAYPTAVCTEMWLLCPDTPLPSNVMTWGEGGGRERGREGGRDGKEGGRGRIKGREGGGRNGRKGKWRLREREGGIS